MERDVLAAIPKMRDFIKEAISYVEPTDDNAKMMKESYEKLVESTLVAEKHMADNKEKQAWLYAVLADHAARVMFYLYRKQLIPAGGIEAKFFEFEDPATALEFARSFAEPDNKILEELAAKQREVANRRKGIDIFKDIIAGKDPEQAKKDMDEFEARQAQAQAQMVQQMAAQPRG